MRKQELPANAEQVQGDEAWVRERLQAARKSKLVLGIWANGYLIGYSWSDARRRLESAEPSGVQVGAGEAIEFRCAICSRLLPKPTANGLCDLHEQPPTAPAAQEEAQQVSERRDNAMEEDERWVRERKQYATPFECTSKGVIVGYVIADAMTGKQLGDISTFSYGPVARRLAWRNAADRLGKPQAETASTEQKVLCRALSADKMVECEKLAGHQPANEHEGHFADKPWRWTAAPAVPESSADAVAMPTEFVTLEAAALAATPQDLTTACEVSNGYYECPSCDGAGEVYCGGDYTNYDHVAQTVHFYGVGDDFVRSEAYFRAASPAVILKLIAAYRAAATYLTPRETAPADLLPCGHQKSEMLTSVETGETLYCALCDKVAAACDRKIEEFVAEKDAEIAKLKLRLSSAPADAALKGAYKGYWGVAYAYNPTKEYDAMREWASLISYALLAQGDAGAKNESEVA